MQFILWATTGSLWRLNFVCTLYPVDQGWFIRLRRCGCGSGSGCRRGRLRRHGSHNLGEPLLAPCHFLLDFGVVNTALERLEERRTVTTRAQVVLNKHTHTMRRSTTSEEEWGMSKPSNTLVTTLQFESWHSDSSENKQNTTLNVHRPNTLHRQTQFATDLHNGQVVQPSVLSHHSRPDCRNAVRFLQKMDVTHSRLGEVVATLATEGHVDSCVSFGDGHATTLCEARLALDNEAHHSACCQTTT